MNRQERIDYLTKKHSGWKVWDIKNPWLRLPVVWLLAAVGAAIWMVVYVVSFLAEVRDGFVTAFEAANETVSPKMLWKAMTDTSRGKP